MKPLIAALHESLVGTFRTWRDVCRESAMRTIVLKNSVCAELQTF
jgi:hypothetical protein